MTQEVRSVPMKDGQPIGRQRVDAPILLARLGVWLMVISFGGIFWAINGGFSVIGLGVIASSFNDAGRLAWVALTAITFALPVQVPGVSLAQPLIPWLGVIAASLLQICVTWLKLQGRTIPTWLIVFAGALSIYDLATTFFGIGTIKWIQQAGYVVQGPIAALLTFGLEVTIGFLLRRR